MGGFSGDNLGARKPHGIGVHVVDVAVQGLVGFGTVVDDERVRACESFSVNAVFYGS